jgi:hypothetical protein
MKSTRKRTLESIPEVSLDSILDGKKPTIQLRVMPYEDGMMPANDAVALLSLLVADKPKAVVEIGTLHGHTTRAIAENIYEGTVYTVDLPPDYDERSDEEKRLPKDDFHLIRSRVVGREFKGQACEGKIRQVFGDTAKLDFGQFKGASFFFIDGSHTYEYVKNDSEKCISIAPKGSAFLWHDCDLTHPGVTLFLKEWRSLGRKIVRIAGTQIAYWRFSEESPVNG